MKLPLDGLIVLDLTIARAGPACVRHLADWGAEVIRVEQPIVGTDEMFGRRDGADFQNLHRNKRAIELNLKDPASLQALFRLVEKADVVVENMRSGVKYRLGIDYESLRRINPRIVYGGISGFGQTGPYANRAGVDQIVQGMGGLMSITGAPGQGPMRVGIAVADVVAGNVLAMGILMALYERERTGEGRWVHTSLLETQVNMLDFQAARWLVECEVAKQSGNDHPTGIPNGVYNTADDPINISAVGPRLWDRFANAVGHPEWLENPDWQTVEGRSLARHDINAAITAVTSTKPSAYWIDFLNGIGIPCGPIYSIDQVFDDPQVQHLGMAAPVDIGGTPRAVVASPLNFSGVEKIPMRAAPARGGDTEAVLQWAGLSDTEIEEVQRAKYAAG